MTVQTWEIMSLVGFIMGGLSLIAAGLLFWRGKIPKAIGDLSGKTARKAIEDIQKRSEETGRAYSRSRSLKSGVNPASAVNLSGNLIGQTDALPENAEPTSRPAPMVEDVALTETSVLAPPPSDDLGETSVLPLQPTDDPGETALLSPKVQGVTVIADITFIHSDEVI